MCQALMVPRGVTAAIPVTYWQPLIWAASQREGETDAHSAGLGTREDRVQMWGEGWARWFGA